MACEIAPATVVTPAPSIEAAPEESVQENAGESPESASALAQRIRVIEEALPAVGSEIRKAHELSSARPDAALVAARRSLEVLLRSVCEKLPGSPDVKRASLFDLVGELERRGLLPKTITQHLHSVRTLGNIAAHGDSTEVTTDDAHMAVLAALRTAEWAAGGGGRPPAKEH